MAMGAANGHRDAGERFVRTVNGLTVGRTSRAGKRRLLLEDLGILAKGQKVVLGGQLIGRR